MNDCSVHVCVLYQEDSTVSKFICITKAVQGYVFFAELGLFLCAKLTVDRCVESTGGYCVYADAKWT
jgi:hypothetical protein